MANTPTFTDRFARRSAPARDGLGKPKDAFAPKPPSQPKLKTPAKPQAPKGFARPAKAAKVSAKPADAFSRTPEAAMKRAGFAGPAPKAQARPPKMTAPRKQALKVEATTRPPAQPKTALKPAPAPPREKMFKPPARAKAAPLGAGFVRKPAPPQPPAPLKAEPAKAPMPLHAELFPTEPARTPLHVVASAPDTTRGDRPSKSRPAARSSSLVLVTGAGAVAAAETLDAPPAAEKPVAPEAPPADPPPAVAEPAPEARKGGDSGGDGPGGGSGTPPPGPRAKAARGFNQDDLFGAVFSVAVVAFLLMWLMRGKPAEEGSDQLLAAQSAPTPVAALEPAPAPKLNDPNPGAPIDLRPSGPIVETPFTEDSTTLESAPAAPPAIETTPPPAVAAPPPVTAAPAPPLAEQRMNAWFCTASTRLTKASRGALESELGRFAEVFKGKELVVRGYADTRGSTDYNAALGGERAKVVADFLRTKNLVVHDENVSGVGELEGLDDNQNCPNQRRVDVWIKGSAAQEPSRACAPEPDYESLVCGR